MCDQRDPFKDKNDQYFIEVHHVVFLADGGTDTITNAVALCPNCHKKCHYSKDIEAVRDELWNKVERIE